MWLWWQRLPCNKPSRLLPDAKVWSLGDPKVPWSSLPCRQTLSWWKQFELSTPRAVRENCVQSSPGNSHDYLSTCIQKPCLSAPTAPDLRCGHSPLAVLLSVFFWPPLPHSFHDRTSQCLQHAAGAPVVLDLHSSAQTTPENNLQEESFFSSRLLGLVLCSLGFLYLSWWQPHVGDKVLHFTGSRKQRGEGIRIRISLEGIICTV